MNANQALVAKFIKQGSIGVSLKLTTDAYIKRQIRERYHAQGLTSTGRKPAKRKLPQFATLTGKDYHREYMRQWRSLKNQQIQPRTSDG